MILHRILFYFVCLYSLINAENPCRFEHSKGIIDLSSLGKSDGTAAFPDEPAGAGSNYKYSYNPCKPFTEGDDCLNVAACQVSFDLKYRFALGTQDSAVWSAGAGLGANPSISYSLGPKQVQVSLMCSDSMTPDFEALGEDPMNFYKFRLTHKCACWNGCSGSPETTTKKGGGGGGGSGGIGGGTVFIIILLVLIFVYIVGFVSYYRFRHQRSGVELIPHRTFWVALPSYAKDGAVFTFRRITGKGDAGGYQSA